MCLSLLAVMMRRTDADKGKLWVVIGFGFGVIHTVA